MLLYVAWRVHDWVATPEVLQLPTPGMSTDAFLERSPCANIFRFSGGDSQKSVAVVGEAESALSYCGGRKTIECSGVRILSVNNALKKLNG